MIHVILKYCSPITLLLLKRVAMELRCVVLTNLLPFCEEVTKAQKILISFLSLPQIPAYRAKCFVCVYK